MRYRPFAFGGQSVSAVTLGLPPGLKRREAEALVCLALECGINSYVMSFGDLVAAEAVCLALSTVERRMLQIGVRARPPIQRPDIGLREMLTAGALGYADAFLLDVSGSEAVDDGELLALDRLRRDRMVARLGVWGEGDGPDAQIARLDFDILATRYNVRSGWVERNRIKAATQRGLAILGFGAHIDAARSAADEHAPKGALRRLFHRPSPQLAHAYDFLNATPGWTAEQLTLAYALTEPALASVVVETADPRILEAATAAVERELPSAAAAQIEIARIAA